MSLVAVIAVALALARLPVVWEVLDARRSGPLAAVLRYISLWTGLTISALVIRSPSGRLVAYGWVLIGSLVISFFFPHLHVGIEPDLSAYFNLATVLAACALWFAGWLMGRLTERARVKPDPANPPDLAP